MSSSFAVFSIFPLPECIICSNAPNVSAVHALLSLVLCAESPGCMQFRLVQYVYEYVHYLCVRLFSYICSRAALLAVSNVLIALAT